MEDVVTNDWLDWVLKQSVLNWILNWQIYWIRYWTSIYFSEQNYWTGDWTRRAFPVQYKKYWYRSTPLDWILNWIASSIKDFTVQYLAIWAIKRNRFPVQYLFQYLYWTEYWTHVTVQYTSSIYQFNIFNCSDWLRPTNSCMVHASNHLTLSY